MENPVAYYASSGPMTDPKEYGYLFAGLPIGASALADVVQGLLLHIFWAERYDVILSEERQQEVQIRPVDQKLARILELDGRPLSEARPLERKLVGNCRDFAVLLCAMLRHQGMPARARCGFGAYFLPGHYEDHWVCECWNADQARWILVDAQLDAFQQEELAIQFDPLDVPHNQFITGGRAWQMCRAGGADPDKFGILDMHGLWFVRDNLVRDFLSLNKVEILPWDGDWDFLKDEEDLAAEILDRLAVLTLAGDEAFDEIRTMYEGDGRFHFSWTEEDVMEFSPEQLNEFIVKAKAATYVGGGAKSPSCRPESHDLQFQHGPFSYLDSYFGNANFIGQEVVYYEGTPVWAMNYYGRILEPTMIDAAEAGEIIQESLSQMYTEGRFLGGFEHATRGSIYVDTSEGGVASFAGREWIEREGVRVYELVYHGGLVK